jgi:hypothetical protein
MPTTVTEFIQDRAGKMTFEMSDGSVKTFDPLTSGQVNTYNRTPTASDNTSIGITAAGQPWQSSGVIYETITAPTSTGATWQVATQQGGLPEPVLGASTIKFMGGTMAGKPGLNGKAIQISCTISSATVTQDISFINGEFDVKSASSFMARADAGTIPEVSRVYHQLDDTVFAIKNSTRNQLLLVWDPVIQNYMLTGTGTSSCQLIIPASVTVSKNNFGLIFYGRGANASDSGQSGCHYGSVGDATHYAGLAGYGTGGLYGSCGSDGNQIATGGAIIAPEAGASIVGLNSDPSAGWRLWANELEAGAGNVDVSGLTLAGGFIGSNDGGTTAKAGQFRTMLMVITNSSVSQVKRDSLKRWVYRTFNTQPQVPNLVVMTGDSRAMGTNTQYMDTPGLILRQLIKSSARVYNIANGGAKITDIQTNVLPNLAKLIRSGGKSVYISILDVNDINTPLNPDTVFASKKAEVAAAKALGFSVVVVYGLRTTNNSLGLNGVANKVNLDTLNSLYTAAGSQGLGADAIVDAGVLQSASQPTITQYYSDGIHQQGATNFAIMTLVAPVVDSLLT